MTSTERRSANYKPNIWNHDYIESIHSVYGERKYLDQAEKLKEEVRNLLEKTNNPIDQILLVSALQRLGISYHFTEPTNKVVKNIHNIVTNSHDCSVVQDMQAISLGFMLLRQQGYKIDPEVFRFFLDDEGNFKEELCHDNINGLLSLYDASFLSMEDEAIMDAARVFATCQLKQKLEEKDIDQNLANYIHHVLEFPFHRSMQRIESKFYVDNVYGKQQCSVDPIVLEFAKLYFNISQKMHQDELKELSRWYVKSGLCENVKFARHRLVESFLWAVGFVYEPHLKYCRAILTKCIILITIIDDVYDVYGSLDELEIFTDVVNRWDVNQIDRLPNYMKICFLVLFNTVNEMGYELLKDDGLNVISYAAKSWMDLFKTYLTEAKWFYSGYKPSFEEYQKNGWCSIGYHVTAVHAYLCTMNPLKDQKSLEDLMTYPEIVKGPGSICRLLDDLGNSTDELERGDTLKSVQCYMNDMGVCEDDSRSYIKDVIDSKWKTVNKDLLMNTEYSRDFITMSLNLIRTVHRLYHHGDGHGVPDQESKTTILSLLIQPIHLQ